MQITATIEQNENGLNISVGGMTLTIPLNNNPKNPTLFNNVHSHSCTATPHPVCGTTIFEQVYNHLHAQKYRMWRYTAKQITEELFEAGIKASHATVLNYVNMVRCGYTSTTG